MSIQKPSAMTPLAALIFSSRWLQLPLYVGLILAQCVYVVLFGKELWHSAARRQQHQRAGDHAGGARPDRRGDDLQPAGDGDRWRLRDLRVAAQPGEPSGPAEWLSHVNASVLKVKLALAIIGISSIHLLKTFIEAGALGSSRAGNYTETGVMWQTIIHTVFILSAVGIA
jgi:uncharacterized membrane protein YqhA